MKVFEAIGLALSLPPKKKKSRSWSTQVPPHCAVPCCAMPPFLWACFGASKRHKIKGPADQPPRQDGFMGVGAVFRFEVLWFRVGVFFFFLRTSLSAFVKNRMSLNVFAARAESRVQAGFQRGGLACSQCVGDNATASERLAMNVAGAASFLLSVRSAVMVLLE